MKNNNGVSFSELIRFVFAKPYSLKFKSVVQKIIYSDKYNQIFFEGKQHPLFYPTTLPLESLQMVVVESFDKFNWHYYEIEEMKIQNDDIVIDCGAAEGLFSFLVNDRCKKVYAIEPLPIFCEAMERTFIGNNNIEILQYALSDTESKAILMEDDISSSLLPEGKGMPVNATTLDKLFYYKNLPITYIKADLEGYDLKALVGATQLIKKYKPRIAITTYHKYEHASQISDFLLSIVPAYKIKTRGIHMITGSPIMLYAWL